MYKFPYTFKSIIPMYIIYIHYIFIMNINKHIDLTYTHVYHAYTITSWSAHYAIPY